MVTVLLAVLYTSPVLFLGETYFFRDLYQHFLPQRVTAAEQIADSEIPLWDPNVQGGCPLLANPNNLVLYPGTLLYVVLPPLEALNLEIALHLLLAMAGTWLLSRDLGLSSPAALAAGAIYGFAGVTLSLLNFLNHFFALALAPLLLLAWLRLLATGRRRWLAAVLVVGVCEVLAGGVETTLAVLVTVAVLTAVRTRRSGRSWAGAALLAAAGGALVAGVAAIQLLPAAELTAQSVRSAGLPYGARVTWSLVPQRLPELILPGFMGRVDTLAAGDFWGRYVQDQHFPYILSIYFGAVTLLLAVTGLTSRSETGLSRGTRRSLGVVAAAGLVLALGQHVPGFAVLWTLPGLALLRYPVKLVVLAVLPVALLAGAGIDAVSRPPRSRRVAGLLVAGAVGCVASACVLASSAHAARFVEELFFATHGPEITAGLLRSLVHALAGLALAAAVLVLLSPKSRTWGLAVVVAADLLVAGLPVNPHSPRAFFSSEDPPLVRVARRDLGGGRLYRDAAPAGVTLRAPANDVVYQVLWNLEVLHFYLGAYYQLPVVFNEDYDGLASRRVVALGGAVRKADWERRLALLSAASVSLVVTHDPPPLPGLEPVARVPNAGSSLVYAYRNREAVPRARFVTRAVPVDDAAAAVRAMLVPGYDPAVEAVIEGLPPAVDPGGPCVGGAVIETELGTAHTRYRVRVPCTGYLVLADPWYEGWRLSVDGRPVDLLHADAAFGAVALSRGNHEIDQRYWPVSFVRGRLCTLAFVVLTVLAVSSRRLARLGLGRYPPAAPS